jgi:ATP-dependent helicase/nuclease subunit A
MSVSALQQQQETQRGDALNPHQSIWVSASAGSGKTTLLTQRVLRLLLQGLMDGRKKLPNILCVTYTKAGAAEMQNRIHEQLAAWATWPEDKLQDSLDKNFNIHADTKMLNRARRLFALVLERPDCVRIMTMHAFCQMLLHRFPLEAGLAPHFTLLEGDAQKTFETAVLSRFVANVKSDTTLNASFETLASSQGSQRTRDMLQQVFYNASRWENYFAMYSDVQIFASVLQKEMALDFIGDAQEFLTKQCANTPHADLKHAAQALQSGGKTDKDRACAILTWINDVENRTHHFDIYAQIFLTKEGEKRAKLCTVDVVKKHPETKDVLDKEALRVQYILGQLTALRFYHQQCAYYRLCSHVWQLYNAEKQRQACLTYDDLILKTRDVLSQEGLSQWVLYKLDGGLDHVLIDEAQDTSPEQWDILFLLLEEFLSGEGARADANRTVFVVGDEKQSIYSFQGANRNYYLDVKNRLFQQMNAAGKTMLDLQRVQSFRSAPTILSYVDAVFASDAQKGVTEHTMRHFSARHTAHGLVELWEPLLGTQTQMPEPWHPPLHREDAQSASVQLAQRIAQTIAAWLQQGWHIKTRETGNEIMRPIRADDIIILLQKRSHLLAPIIRALKDNNVPVAGIDRMRLNEQGAVQDMMTLCRFLLLPHDDLTLAEVLRSPFIRLSDVQLFELAHNRTGNLWQTVQADERYETIAYYLKKLLNRTDRISCFSLLSHFLFEPCPANAQSGQAALISKLGADAIDPLEQLLSAVKRYESQNSLSLQLFVQAIGRDESDIKRDQAKASGEVRIMTTHGAKGLEAPIVFVPDMMRDAGIKWNMVTQFWHEKGFALAATAGAGDIPIVKTVKENMQTAQEEENRRLLYVALTRAADVLILCGAVKKEKEKTKDSERWYAHCLSAMTMLDAPEENNAWRYGDVHALSPFERNVARVVAPPAALPAWVHRALPDIQKEPRIYNPSAFVEQDEYYDAPQAQGETSSYQRGRMLHRLLQLLPELPEQQREDAAIRYLKNQQVDDYAHDVKEVLAIVQHPVFASIFSNAAQAEVPIVGRVFGKMVSGQIDRLLVTDTDVLVIDFKTNRPPPKTLDGVADSYLAQMACYVALLEKIYPAKTIRAALLWTHSLTLMELDADSIARGTAILRKT